MEHMYMNYLFSTRRQNQFHNLNISVNVLRLLYTRKKGVFWFFWGVGVGFIYRVCCGKY
jgi:hypothetical protein